MKRKVDDFAVMEVWARLNDFPQLSQMLAGRLTLEEYLKNAAKETLKLLETNLEDHRVRQGVVESLDKQRKALDSRDRDNKKILDVNFRYAVAARDLAFNNVKRCRAKLDYIKKQLRRIGAQ